MLVDCGFTGLTKQGIENQKSELDKLTFYQGKEVKILPI